MTVRKAILGTKLGMTQVFGDDGRAVPVTVIEAGPCTVTQVRTPERDGYHAVQLSLGEVLERRLTKPQRGHLLRSGAAPSRTLVEVRTDDAGTYTPGQILRADVFAPGDKVDAVGMSKGKGFAGAMKRWNFRGKRASHGTERKHRSPGSQNAGTTPGRVFPGKKLPGRLGFSKVAILSLEIVESDPERNLLLVKGAVPGPVGGTVVIRTAVKTKVSP